MPRTKTPSTDAYRRVPYKTTPYRKFTPYGPSVKMTRPAGQESSPAAREFSRKLPELRNDRKNPYAENYKSEREDDTGFGRWYLPPVDQEDI